MKTHIGILFVLGFTSALKSANADDDASDGVPSCKIKEIPKNGYVGYLVTPNSHLEINDVISNFAKIRFTCIENHLVVGNKTNLSLKGKWIGRTPECKPFCSPDKITSITFQAACSYQKRSVRCWDPSVPGTVARTTCKQGYESFRPELQDISCGMDGRWNPEPTPCTQICGEEVPEATPHIIGGVITNITQVPWHVAIYREQPNEHPKLMQICGGSILNPKIVISAMHCFWDRKNNQPYNASLFSVKAGKSLREYDDINEKTNSQTFSVDKIFFDENYRDVKGLYANDIAILVLNKNIEYHTYISPVCINNQLHNEEKTVPSGWKGRVAGWGLDINNQPSPDLKMIELPVIDREECKKESPTVFIPFITNDKFCAGHLTGQSVCSGDSGGGLVFPDKSGAKLKYFLRGIVSVGPANNVNMCDYNRYTTFTNTAYFSDFLSNKLALFEHGGTNTNNEDLVREIEYGYCDIMEIPMNGTISPLGSPRNLTLGEKFPNYGAVQFSCNENFTLVGDTTSVCINGNWTNIIPLCNPSSNVLDTGSCRILSAPNNGWIEYADDPYTGLTRGQIADPDTKIKYLCLENHFIDDFDFNYCVNGKWLFDVPDCLSRCKTEIPSGISIQSVNCYHKNRKVDCITDARLGTVMEISCRSGYEIPHTNRTKKLTECTDDGYWTPYSPSQKCTPICGRSTPLSTPYSEGNDLVETKITSAPWHVGIYRNIGGNFQLMCGGSIFNETVVISAANCFWNMTEHTVLDLSLFRVAAGKSLSGYSVEEYFEPQFFEVERLFYKDNYGSLITFTKALNKSNSIAYVVLKTHIEFQPHIMPVCLQERRDIYKDTIGTMVGWVSDQPSDVLKLAQTTTEDTRLCSLKEFNSGGGFVIPQTEFGREKFYLRGIITTQNNITTNCSISEYGYLTKYIPPFVRALNSLIG